MHRPCNIHVASCRYTESEHVHEHGLHLASPLLIINVPVSTGFSLCTTAQAAKLLQQSCAGCCGTPPHTHCCSCLLVPTVLHASLDASRHIHRESDVQSATEASPYGLTGILGHSVGVQVPAHHHIHRMKCWFEQSAATQGGGDAGMSLRSCSR